MLKAKRLIILALLVTNCDTGNLTTIIDLPIILNEVSGVETDAENSVFWMVNDSGNKPILYGLDSNGNIIKSIKIKAKNRDWEDLTTDPRGNVYIGNFGNNSNDSKELSILKISIDSIVADKTFITPEVIKFKYPEQKKFPPKKSKRHFDCEAFFYFNDSLYLFTKSRQPKKPGKTKLYKLPVTKGTYKAEYIDTFNTCDDSECWVTSADINAKGNKLALLTENSVFVFSNLKSSAFFKSDLKRYVFDYKSQKESVAFKNDSTLYIADEYLGVDGGNLYEFKID
ncbi:MAG: hypothetical protein ED556_00380 [Winogradskyella sp.]|uniref:hypothetical protein n=1 Tax=Winogradskyella sp. TaxID=1883156 RepID=UPI000F41C469|nr:hypothetical protein [Winogradskyella sp.]RNC87681.1 MAG: hypothetical protein ED556_00380 [Winogradskyella sp.]